MWPHLSPSSQTEDRRMNAEFHSSWIVRVALACALLAAGGASAQQKLTVAGYGGSYEDMMRKEIIPAFEHKTGAKVEYVAGNSTDNIARMQAQRANPEIDVLIADDGPMYQAVALGLCTDLKGIDFNALYPVANMKTGKSVTIGVVATGIVYNKKYFDDNKIPAPTSWNDLKDPKFKKKLVIPPMNNSYGLHAVVMYARLNGGGEKNIDPGFKVFKDEIGPNVLAYEPQPGKMTELFQSGQAVIGIWGSGRVKVFKETGFPVEFVIPKEGSPALGISACPAAKPSPSPLAQQFIQFLVQPDIQALHAKGAGAGPVNKSTTLAPDVAKGLPYGDAVGKLIALDWDTMNANRTAWNNRWTREIER
jgi:putative spermidine/putrescine transport system substrate-binding protein